MQEIKQDQSGCTAEMDQEPWSPVIIAGLNGQELKLPGFAAEFVWHLHEHEDEAFMVIEGAFDMHFRNKVVHLEKGEIIVVPKGTEHKPVAEQDAVVLLLSPLAPLIQVIPAVRLPGGRTGN